MAHHILDRDTVLTAVVDLGGHAQSQVIINTGKLGRVIGLDPSGKVLWDTPVGMHQNDDLTPFEGSLEVLPGAAGGVVTPHRCRGWRGLCIGSERADHLHRS